MSSRDDALQRALARRAPLAQDKGLNAYRLVNADGDALPGLTADRLGDMLYLQVEADAPWRDLLPGLLRAHSWQGLCLKNWRKSVRGQKSEELKPEILEGSVPDVVTIKENSLSYELRPFEGYSYGIFLDQRVQRARLLKGLSVGMTLLNTFAYTCAFSLAAARAGARAISVDLSKKYLEWGQRNFALNDIAASEHEFLSGDVREWFRRMQRKGQNFDCVILDPPTFASSKKEGIFRVEEDYPELLKAALALTKAGGRVICSQNKRELTPPRFESLIQSVLTASGSKARIQSQDQPLDFPGNWERNPSARVVWLEL